MCEPRYPAMTDHGWLTVSDGVAGVAGAAHRVGASEMHHRRILPDIQVDFTLSLLYVGRAPGRSLHRERKAKVHGTCCICSDAATMPHLVWRRHLAQRCSVSRARDPSINTLATDRWNILAAESTVAVSSDHCGSRVETCRYPVASPARLGRTCKTRYTPG